MMVRTKIFVKEDTKMLYTEKEKHEIERVKEVFAEHLRQSPDFELLWSDKVGYVWLTIGVNPDGRRFVYCHVPLCSGSWGAASNHTWVKRMVADPEAVTGTCFRAWW